MGGDQNQTRNISSFGVALKIYHCHGEVLAPCPVFLASSCASRSSRARAGAWQQAVVAREEENKAQPLRAATTHRHLPRNMDLPWLVLFSSLLEGRS